MEAIPPNLMLLVQFVRNAIHVGVRWHGCVECRIEHGNLKKPASDSKNRTEAGKASGPLQPAWLLNRQNHCPALMIG